MDKWKETGLTPVPGEKTKAPMVAESPVNIECRVVEKKELGSHSMFLAEVVAVHADEAYMDEAGRFSLNDARPIVYSHGKYLAVGKELGSFGYSVQKKPKSGNGKQSTSKRHK